MTMMHKTYVAGAHGSCERIEEVLNVEYSPPRRGGVAAASIKSCEATECAADGVVSSAKSSGLNRFAELLLRLRPIGLALRATPAAVSEPIHFTYAAATLLCEEGNSLREFNSFTRSESAPTVANSSCRGGPRSASATAHSPKS